jgi:hypothetical protein
LHGVVSRAKQDILRGCSTQALGREGNAAHLGRRGFEADAPGEIAVKFTPLSGGVIGKSSAKNCGSAS